VIHGIGNIIRWTPIIWDDADFDWAYLARIMEYKLRRMSKTIGDGYIANAERYSRQMLICAAIMLLCTTGCDNLRST